MKIRGQCQAGGISVLDCIEVDLVTQSTSQTSCKSLSVHTYAKQHQLTEEPVLLWSMSQIQVLAMTSMGPPSAQLCSCPNPEASGHHLQHSHNGGRQCRRVDGAHELREIEHHSKGAAPQEHEAKWHVTHAVSSAINGRLQLLCLPSAHDNLDHRRVLDISFQTPALAWTLTPSHQAQDIRPGSQD